MQGFVRGNLIVSLYCSDIKNMTVLRFNNVAGF